MSSLPSRVLNFLLTDIEGRTSLWEEHADAMKAALRHEDELAEGIVGQHRGQLVPARGEGDS